MFMKFINWSTENKAELLDLMSFFKSLNFDIQIKEHEVMFTNPKDHIHVNFLMSGEQEINKLRKFIIESYKYYLEITETITHEYCKNNNIDTGEWIISRKGNARIVEDEKLKEEEKFIKSLYLSLALERFPQ